MWLSQQPPRIEAVAPDSFVPRSTVVVEGHGFGDAGRLAIDQRAIPETNIRRWTPNLIVFDAPDRARSGLLRVTTSDGTSNPMFVTAEEDIPVRLRDRLLEISRLNPESARVGSRIVLEGYGFGPRSAMAEISFVDDPFELRVGADREVVLEWSDRRIEMVLPHDLHAGDYQVAVNGVHTESHLTVSPPYGERILGDRGQLAVRTAIAVRNRSVPVYALLPGGLTFREQPAAQLIRENLDSQSMGLGPDATYYLSPSENVQRIDRVVLTERRSVRWTIEESSSSEVLLEPWFRNAYRSYLSETGDIPHDSSLVAELRGRLQLRDPVGEIARAIHTVVISTLTPDVHGGSDPVQAVEEEMEVGSYAYASLATALARSVGIPARRHFGVLLDDGGRSVLHAWVEFLVPGAGWIPADPALGDGLLGEDLASFREFYGDDLERGTFGNLDGRRITLSVDGREVPRLYPAGTIREPDNNWAPGVLRLESPRESLPADLEVRWESPVLFGWFD